MNLGTDVGASYRLPWLNKQENEVVMIAGNRKAVCLAVLTGLFLWAVGPTVHASQAGKGLLKVFILAGQSNMQGKGAANTLDYLGEDPMYGGLLKKIKKKDGSWIVRDDVWVWYLGRKGKLTIGYGAEGSSHGKLFGPELGFGHVMGDLFEDQVLLLKTAWGGKALATDFLPPGAGGPGPFYTNMVNAVRDVLKNLKTEFPEYNGKGYEIAGFVWFQGWNDMVDDKKIASYAANLAHLVRDIRNEFDVPGMPVVVGELGVGGPEPSESIAKFRKAQQAGATLPEFKGTVKFVKTAEFYDLKAEKMFRDGVWRRKDEAHKYYRIASERPFHYLGSGKIFYLMGHAFGEGMKELLSKKTFSYY